MPKFEEDVKEVIQNLDEPKKEKRVKIVIDEQDSAEGASDVMVGVNGKVWQIQRGKEVVVPESVVDVLKNAVMSKIVQGEGSKPDTKRDIPRFVYRIVE